MRSAIATMVIWVAWVALAAPASTRQTPGTGSHPAPNTPDGVIQRFARLDADGGQLIPDGWNQIASLFVQPGPRRSPASLSIVRDGVGVSKAKITSDRTAIARLDYTHLGFLDIASGVYRVEHSGLHLLEHIKLVLVPAATSQGASLWKIEGSVPDPNITRTAAIRYVTQLLKTTKDEKVRKNAGRTLAALKRER